MNQTDIQLENSSGLGKLIMMGVFSLLLCMSILMSVFTPYPIGLSSVLYGRLKASLVAFVALIVCYTLVGSMFQDISIFIFFAFSIAIAFGLAEVVLREVNPISGIIGLGILVTVFSSMVVFISMSSSDKTIKGLLISEFEKIQPLLEEQKKKMQASGEKGSFEVEALLSQPELLAEKVLAEAPSYFFIGVFVMLWANLFLLLKSNRLVKKMNN
ncbi:MAG: hypothetical protein HON90_15005, partial [Halobacteriovoraceae bacterium]|nr:hypothetical protein [Halobacteriovoraceae bacterium]